MIDVKEQKLLTLWILLLSFASGFANVVAILNFLWPVSHVTGLTSQLALAMAKGETEVMSLLMKGFLLFFLGATLAGVLFHNRNFQLRRRYGVLLFIGGLLIFLLRNSSHLHYYLFSYMGMVNGMFIHYRGIIVRATHVSGYLTDAGFELGVALRGKKVHYWKIAFYLGSIFLFFTGGYAASMVPGQAVTLLSLMYMLLGIYYFILRKGHGVKVGTR